MPRIDGHQFVIRIIFVHLPRRFTACMPAGLIWEDPLEVALEGLHDINIGDAAAPVMDRNHGLKEYDLGRSPSPFSGING